jgi:cyclophilin family peptidyl-prolyl cis-trans isomerase/HEAT repeat protein
MTHPETGPACRTRRLGAWRGVLAPALAAMSAYACASAPAVAPAKIAAVPLEQKLAWMLQLEDQRILKLPEPPPAPPPVAPVKGRRAAPPPPPPMVPDLTRLTTDADPRVRRRAAVAIGRVGLKDGIPALTPLLADPDTDVRQSAAFALGLIGDRASSAALVSLLKDPDPLVRGRAAEGLGLMGAEDTASAIAAMTAPLGRSAAVIAMTPDDERSPAPPEAEAFKLGLFALVRLRAYEPLATAALDGSGGPVSTWWPVAYALQRNGDARAASALRQLLTVKGRYTPAFAARGLGRIKDPTAAKDLLPLLEPTTQPREVVASAIAAVREVGVPQAGPRLGLLASDPAADGNLRMEALTTLGTLRALDQLPIVQDLITDDWPALRAAAIRAAVAIDPDNFTLILSGLDIDRHWLGRAALADALGTLPPAVALIRLNELVNDEDKRVVPHALRALVRLKAPAVDTILLARLKDQDYALREAVAALVGEVKPADGVSALKDAYQAALPDAAYGARAAAIAALAEYGTSEAVEAIRAALLDKDWAVRLRAADLLTKLDPSGDHQHAIRPVPNAPMASYDDPTLTAPPTSPHVFIETAKGTIEFELAVLDAPQTARSFVTLARKGFFNGLQVHRVVPNFVMQDGDPRGDGEGGPGYTLRDELTERPYLRGTVGMALSSRDDGGSQFFITHSPQPHLDGRYPTIGHVVNGMDVVDRIQVGDTIVRVRVWDGKWE